MADSARRLSWCISTAPSPSAFPLPLVRQNFPPRLWAENMGIREDSVKWRIFGLQVNSLLWQIKIMNGGQHRRLILHIVTHGSRCVVSAWIPVSNYLSASAHWCHSFPVITQSPACQGQVTSRWAWLVPDWDPHSVPLPLPPRASRHNLSASGLFVHLHRVMVAIGPLETSLLVIAPLRQH